MDGKESSSISPGLLKIPENGDFGLATILSSLNTCAPNYG
jgi:hypothetical protein